MEGEGFVIYKNSVDIIWSCNVSGEHKCKHGPLHEQIKDNEILEAAVVAATRYFEEKGENK